MICICPAEIAEFLGTTECVVKIVAGDFRVSCRNIPISLRSVVASTSVASGFSEVGTTQARAAQSEWLPRLQVRALVKMAARCF